RGRIRRLRGATQIWIRPGWAFGQRGRLSKMRSRRIVVRGLLAMTTALVAAFLASLPWSFLLQEAQRTVILAHGRVSWFSVVSSDLVPVGSFSPGSGCFLNHNAGWPLMAVWFGVSLSVGVPVTEIIQIPLWLPMFLTATPALFLAFYRCRLAPGRCGHCG